MKKIKWIILAILMLQVFVPGALGNDKGGNGGKVRVEFNSSDIRKEVARMLKENVNHPNPTNPFTIEYIQKDVKKVESLDLHEYIRDSDFFKNDKKYLDLSKKYKDRKEFKEATEFVLARIKDKSFLGDKLFYILENEIKWEGCWEIFPGVADTHDSHHSKLEDDTHIVVQVAEKRVEDDGRIQVRYDQFLFSKLNLLHRVGLILHELTYHLAVRDFSHKSSLSIRQIVGFVLLDSFDKMDVKNINHYITSRFEQSKDPKTRWEKIFFEMPSHKAKLPVHEVAKSRQYGGWVVRLPNITSPDIKNKISFNQIDGNFIGERLFFHPDKSVYLGQNKIDELSLKHLEVEGIKTGKTADEWWSFYPSGNIREFDASIKSINLHQGQIRLKRETSGSHYTSLSLNIELYDNEQGVLKKMQGVGGVIFSDANLNFQGKKVKMHLGFDTTLFSCDHKNIRREILPTIQWWKVVM